jgi:hypothetical protein
MPAGLRIKEASHWTFSTMDRQDQVTETTTTNNQWPQKSSPEWRCAECKLYNVFPPHARPHGPSGPSRRWIAGSGALVTIVPPHCMKRHRDKFVV